MPGRSPRVLDGNVTPVSQVTRQVGDGSLLDAIGGIGSMVGRMFDGDGKE